MCGHAHTIALKETKKASLKILNNSLFRLRVLMCYTMISRDQPVFSFRSMKVFRCYISTSRLGSVSLSRFSSDDFSWHLFLLDLRVIYTLHLCPCYAALRVIFSLYLHLPAHMLRFRHRRPRGHRRRQTSGVRCLGYAKESFILSHSPTSCTHLAFITVKEAADGCGVGLVMDAAATTNYIAETRKILKRCIKILLD